MPYEGCQIAVFAKASSNRGASFVKAAASVALKTDNMAGQSVTVFQEKRDDDTRTTFVAFPKPNLVIACTNRDYLSEVLQRIGGKIGKRALPDTLAECLCRDAVRVGKRFLYSPTEPRKTDYLDVFKYGPSLIGSLTSFS